MPQLQPPLVLREWVRISKAIELASKAAAPFAGV